MVDMNYYMNYMNSGRVWKLDVAVFTGSYPLEIKHGWKIFELHGGFKRKTIDKWSMFHCHV